MSLDLQRRVEEARAVLESPECKLPEVDEEDRPLVHNVIYSLMVCKHPEALCTSWSVSCTATHYNVTAVLPDEFDVGLTDLELIQSLNPLRIASVFVTVSDGKGKIVVRVLNHKQRVSMTQADLIITQKRRRIWSDVGSGQD